MDRITCNILPPSASPSAAVRKATWLATEATILTHIASELLGGMGNGCPMGTSRIEHIRQRVQTAWYNVSTGRASELDWDIFNLWNDKVGKAGMVIRERQALQACG